MISKHAINSETISSYIAYDFIDYGASTYHQEDEEMAEADNIAVEEEMTVKVEQPDPPKATKKEYHDSFNDCTYDLADPCGVNDEDPEANLVNDFIRLSWISDPAV